MRKASRFLNFGRPLIVQEQDSTSSPTKVAATKGSMTSRPQQRLRKRLSQSRGSLKSPVQAPVEPKSSLPLQHPKTLSSHQINQTSTKKGIKPKERAKNCTLQNFEVEHSFKIKGRTSSITAERETENMRKKTSPSHFDKV